MPLSQSAQRPRIAIVGGGPAGLTMAAVLYRHGWKATIFDTDAGVGTRDQGGTLDLHPEDGQLALAKAGLLEGFMAIARHEDQEQRLRDFATAEIIHEEIPALGEGQRPEIDRIVLRRLLLAAVDPADVRWAAKVQGIVEHEDGRYGVQLPGELAGPFDLVVGADGAWSKVRRALTPVMPEYSGVTFVELWLSDVDCRHPDHSRLVGRGTMFALGEGKGVIAQRNGEATIRVYAAFHRDLDEAERVGIPTMLEINDVLAHFENWADPFRALITDAQRVVAVRPIVSLPAALDWQTRSGLTVIGDAAHVMPPLGKGVNLAMLDAAELAEALVVADDWREGVAAFEEIMFARARMFSRELQEGFKEMFGDDGATASLGHLQQSEKVSALVE